MLPLNDPRRRVSVQQGDRDTLVVEIARHKNWLMSIFGLAWFTAFFSVFEFEFIAPFFREPLSSQNLVLFPVIAFIALVYFLGARVAMWRAFGVEQILIENGVFSWTRKALFWRRKLELRVVEITAIRTATPWHNLSNRVELTAQNRHFRIGDMLRRDETYELAWCLRRAIRLPEE